MIKANSIWRRQLNFSCMIFFLFWNLICLLLQLLILTIKKLTRYNFRCDAQALEDALCKRVMITPEEKITRTLDPLGATVSRDGLAKTIYSRLFDWWSAYHFYDFLISPSLLCAMLTCCSFKNVFFYRLVDKINISIGQDPNSNSLIGVLDIYGFESFKTNR